MLQSDLVAAVFRFINFGALIGAGAYLFYIKFLGPIKDQIKEQEVFWRNLKQNRESLIVQQKKLNEEIILQDRYAHELMEKIGYWREAKERQYAADVKEKEQYLENAQARAKKQAGYYQMQLVTHKVLPIAFEQAQASLQEKFSDSDNQNEYLKKCVDRLHERVS